MHHGKEKKYSFKKDGVTYKIQPIVEEDKVELGTFPKLILKVGSIILR